MRKRYTRFILTVLILFISITVITSNRNKNIIELPQKKQFGTAIIITGAAAKIAQEAALLEELDNRGMLNDVVFISGASSGALNAAVLNAILSKKFTWRDYINILESLNNNNVFIKNGSKLPVNTEPLKQLISSIISDTLGYKTLSDLPYPTSFSVVNLKILSIKERTFRLCNKKINPESDSSLNIVDVLMASTAYPLVFPQVNIQNIKTIPDVPYFDGGIASDHIPYRALIQFENYSGFQVNKMIIVSRKRDSIPNLNDELMQFGIDKFKFFDKLGVSPEAISNRGFYKGLKEIAEESPNLAERTYVYVPSFDEEFLMFDFNNLKKQYDVTSNWAKTHDPMGLKEYLESNH